MDNALRGAQDHTAAYINDLVIYHNNWKEDLQYLSDIFRHIQWAGLVINARKYQLVKSEVGYLGYVIEGGTQPITD